MQGMYPDVGSIDTTGQPVESLGDRAFLGRGVAWQMPGWGALLLFENGSVLVIEGPGTGATIEETDAQLIAAAKALQAFPSS